MSKTVTFKREHAIKLESRGRRNNLIFYNISEEENESTTTTEDALYIFMEEKLKMEEEEASDICIERAHRLGKKKKTTNRALLLPNLPSMRIRNIYFS